MGVAMKKDTIQECLKQCQRFQLLAKVHMAQPTWKGTDQNVESTKHSSALRRASMDLTRVLADLRQGR